MKKLIVALLLTGASAFSANATVIQFNDAAFGGSGVLFDEIDWDVDLATVQQTDSNMNGSILGGPDDFIEFGETILVNFKRTGFPNFLPSSYETFFEYSLNGVANATLLDPIPPAFPNPFLFISVMFSGGSADLWADTNVNGSRDALTSTLLGSYTLANGTCSTIVGTVGSCDITMKFNALPGFFFYNGNDLANNNAVYTRLIVTVQDIIGLQQIYPGGAGSTQTFNIRHDGNQTFTVPEPASLAILGLGLLGLGIRRRSKN